MTIRTIGDSPVGSIGLGGVHWSITDSPDADLSVRTIHAAIEAGARLIDTARAYTTLDEESHNEDIVRAALREHPLKDDILIATKGGHLRTGPTTFPIDGRPETLRAHCDSSLRHLGVSRIGLYQLHHPDPAVPIGESVQALAELRSEGKIAMIGISNVDEAQLSEAVSVAQIASVQNEFSPFDASDFRLVQECERRGIAYLAYSPLGGSSRSSSLASATPSADAASRRLGVSVQQVVLAWMLSLSPGLLPIVGARRPESIEDSLLAVGVQLAADELAEIDADCGISRTGAAEAH